MTSEGNTSRKEKLENNETKSKKAVDLEQRHQSSPSVGPWAVLPEELREEAQTDKLHL